MLAKSINRSALLSWSPNFDKNSLVACGTSHFSNESNSKLEFFDLSQEEPAELLSISVPSRFNRILWTSVEGNCKNILVGAFSDEKIELYDIDMLLNAESDGIIEVPKLHSGSVNGLCASFFQPNLIATGATNGEIALWDLDNLKKSYLLSVKKSELFGNTTDIAWNPRVAHIIAAASDAGVVSIIDLRSKKEVTHIKLPNFASASSIAWNPDTPTSIVVSSDDDTAPFAYLWDLRASEVPKNIFKGHSKGISSLSWCRADSKLMLSSGHDGKTLCWNPESNQIIREYSDDESLDVKFCPSDSNIFCVSHLNVIDFRSINDEPFIQEKNCDKICGVAPKWMYCPIGSSFGGKNICSTFRSNSRSINLIRPKIDFFASQVEDLINFDNMITKGLFNEICDKSIEKLSSKDELTIWRLLKSIASPINCTEVLKLAESYNEIISTDSSTYQNIENITRSIDSLNLSKLIDFETSIIDKIIESDLEGAMNDCFAACKPVDALLISNCGGIDLRTKAENYILKNNYSFHLNLAVSLSRNDIIGFASTAPVSDWLRILRVISKYSDKESAHNLFKLLAKRLLDESMYSPALFAAALAVDFELFLEAVLKVTLKNRNSAQDLINFFKIIGIIEALKPNSIKGFEKFSTKIDVFEIVSKLLYMLSSAGFKADFIVNLLDKNFYVNHMKAKNYLIDTFFESMEAPNYYTAEMHPKDWAQSKITPLTHQISSSSILGYAPTKPHCLTKDISGSSSPSQNRNYNDVPMLIPKFSKCSPQLCAQDIRVEDAESALKSLSNSIGSKTPPSSSVRVVEECFKKLSPELICSKNYSDLAKSCIATLLKELSSGNFDLSSTLAANILASFYNETKDWILPLKRLTEIAKN